MLWRLDLGVLSGAFTERPREAFRVLAGIEMTHDRGEKQPRRATASDGEFGTDLPNTTSREDPRGERHAPGRSRAQDSA